MVVKPSLTRPRILTLEAERAGGPAFPVSVLVSHFNSRVPRSRALFATGVPDERWCCGRWGGDGGVR